MFSSDDSRPNSAIWWAAFAVQQMVVPIWSLAITFMAASALEKVDGGVGLFKWLSIAGCYVAPFVGAFVTGFWIGAVTSGFADAGRYIFVIPICIFGAAVVIGLISDPLGTVETYFVADPTRGNTESGLGLALITLPTLSCCAFSLGIRLKKHFRVGPA